MTKFLARDIGRNQYWVVDGKDSVRRAIKDESTHEFFLIVERGKAVSLKRVTAGKVVKKTVERLEIVAAGENI